MNLKNNKILVFDKFLGYNVGGAQKSLHSLLDNLDYDFEFLGCDVKRAFNAEKFRNEKWLVARFNIKEYPRLPYFEYWLNRRRIKTEIAKKQADILVTQGLWGAVAVRFFGGKTVFFIRDQYQLNKIGVYQTGIKKIFKYLYLLLQLPFILSMFRDSKLAIRKADKVIANSEFIKNKIKEKFGVEAEIVYPLVDTESFQPAKIPLVNKKEFITVIGSELIKGRKTVEKVAGLMPEYKFMIVGREFVKPEWKNNIFYQPWVNDVLEIYQKTKILLVPSICEEAFGRTALEAMYLGLPVIGSDRGGLAEVLPEESVVTDVYDYTAWQRKIEDALVHGERYINHKLSKFDFILQINHFKNIITNL